MRHFWSPLFLSIFFKHLPAFTHSSCNYSHIFQSLYCLSIMLSVFHSLPPSITPHPFFAHLLSLSWSHSCYFTITFLTLSLFDFSFLLYILILSCSLCLSHTFSSVTCSQFFTLATRSYPQSLAIVCNLVLTLFQRGYNFAFAFLWTTLVSLLYRPRYTAS